MHGRTIEVGVAGGIDENLEALAFEFEVTVFAHVERHAIFETRATAGLDENTKGGGRIGLLGVQGLNLDGSGFGEVDHGINFIRLEAESREVGECLQLARLLRLARGAGNESAVRFLGVGFASTATE
jgi:hypothetical protein